MLIPVLVFYYMYYEGPCTVLKFPSAPIALAGYLQAQCSEICWYRIYKMRKLIQQLSPAESFDIIVRFPQLGFLSVWFLIVPLVSSSNIYWHYCRYFLVPNRLFQNLKLILIKLLTVPIISLLHFCYIYPLFYLWNVCSCVCPKILVCNESKVESRGLVETVMPWED